MTCKLTFIIGLVCSITCFNNLKKPSLEKVNEPTYLEYSRAYPTLKKLKDWYPNCIANKKDCDKIASYLSRITNYQDSVYHYWNLQSDLPTITTLDTTILPSDLVFLQADSLIISEAKNHKILIINEAHHRPEHRVFTRSLLEKLKKEGLTHVGLEGLICDKALTYFEKSFPTIKDGHYIAEPSYGNLIREAILCKLKLFGYDCGIKEGAKRDIGASNFISDVCLDSSNKTLLHVGWGHVREDDKILGGLLAYRLKSVCNTDPLTIQQTRYMPNFGLLSFDNPLYNKVKSKITQPSIAIYSKGRTYYADSICDMAIFSPDNFIHSSEYRKVRVKNNNNYDGYLLFIPENEKIEDLPVPVCIYAITDKNESLEVIIPIEEKCKMYLLSEASLMNTNEIY